MTLEARISKLVQQGQFKESLVLLKKLFKGPNKFWALKMSGMVYHELGQMQKAATTLKKALRINPVDSETNLYMGSAYHALNQADTALPYLENVYRQQPNNYHALRLLATIALDKKQLPEALSYTDNLIAQWPDKTESNLLRGQAYQHAGMAKKAITAFDKVITLEPERYEGYYCKAAALEMQGQPDKAISNYRKASQLAENPIQTSLDLALLYQKTGRVNEATELYESLNRQYPDNTNILNNLANLYIKLFKISEAITLTKTSVKLEPNNPGSHVVLSSAYKAIGNLNKYIEYNKNAIALMPPEPMFFSTYLLNTNYLPQMSNKELYEEHLKWDKQFAPSTAIYSHESHDYSTNRKLRIGYLSADLKNHAAYYFFEPIFANHDKSRFEIYCYYNDIHKDQITKRFESYTDKWHDIYNLPDSTVADLVFNDNIDILVDLSGHTAGNRLPVVAKKPAPLQIEYEVYPNTTGLSAIDYKLTDRLLDTEDDQQWHSEKLYSLGECFICYQPNKEAPDVCAPPRSNNDYITFGSFSNLYKLNNDVIKLWSKILHKAKNSKLMIVRLSINEHAIEYFVDLFKQEGIENDRLIFIGETPLKYSDYPNGTAQMAIMSDCDIILDSFPYSNHTIACEALWMGIPIITQYGNRHASRVCSSILNAIGHDELIAYSETEYIDKAIELGNNKQRLVDLRNSLRGEFSQSRLMDFPAFTKEIESAYTHLWGNLCNR